MFQFGSLLILTFLAAPGSCSDVFSTNLERTFEIYDELSTYAKIETALLDSGESKTYAQCIVNVLKAEMIPEDITYSPEYTMQQLKTRIGLADELCRIKEYWIPLLVGLVLFVIAILCCCCVLDSKVIPCCCGTRKIPFEEVEYGF